MTGIYYRIEHVTRYVHTGQVSTSQHVGHLTPRSLPTQIVHEHELAIEPRPAELTHRVDAFGNRVTQFAILNPYAGLSVTVRSLVEVLSNGGTIDPDATRPWEDTREAGAYRRGAPLDRPAEFRYPSPYIDLDPELADFARRAFTPRRPILAGAIELMHLIHDDFQFDSAATTITTPVARVLSERRGVCQDFAHLQIACLRSIGIPARYVSGYLLTDPPPGQPRLIGADASHAWLSVWCAPHGWVDVDPTNAVVPGLRHVTLGWGRDYGDVSPLRGVVLGGAEHDLFVGVSVVPHEDHEGH